MVGELLPKSERLRHGIAGLTIVFVVVLAYAASLRGAWVYDDGPGIVENATIRSLSTAWAPPTNSGSPVAGRPLVNLSFAANYVLSGTRPWGYHVANVLIHAAAALLVYGTVRRTLALGHGPAARGGVVGAWVAFVAALLWATHPLGTEAVAYVAQRAESLMALFFLLTLYAFIRAAAGHAGAERGRDGATGGWMALSIAACAAGMATKEVMVSAPIVVLLFDRTFIAGSMRAAWHRRRLYYLGLAATWVVLALLVVGNATRGGTAGFSSGASWWQYAAAQLGAQVWYLRLALWPAPLVFDYGVVALPFTGALLACSLLLAALVAGMAIALARRRAIGWVAIAYFAVLAPSSSVVPIVTEPVAEHRMYLPLALLVAAGVTGAAVLLGRRIGAVAVIAAAALGSLTVARERVYRSELTLWADTVAKVPENARAHYNLALAEASIGRLRVAKAEYEAAIGKNPGFASAHSNLSNTLLLLGDVGGAQREATAALRFNPSLAEAHNNLGNALSVSGDMSGALRAYENALRLVPTSVDFRDNYATALANVGRFGDALAEFEQLVRDHPDSPLLHFNFANTLARAGQLHRAISEYLKTLQLDSNYPRARENLARATQLEAMRRP